MTAGVVMPRRKEAQIQKALKNTYSALSILLKFKETTLLEESHFQAGYVSLEGTGLQYGILYKKSKNL